MHWSDNSGWIMAAHMYSFVQEKMKAMIVAAGFFAMTCDETSGVDNKSYIAVHIYVMQNWTRAPLLVALQQVANDGVTADGLTDLLVGILASRGGLDSATIARKLVCFGADGVSTMQGHWTGVTTQLKDKFAPFMQGQHCIPHRVNLAVKTLSNLDLFHAIEDVCSVTQKYFAHSPKKYAKFHTLALLLDTKGF